MVLSFFLFRAVYLRRKNWEFLKNYLIITWHFSYNRKHLFFLFFNCNATDIFFFTAFSICCFSNLHYETLLGAHYYFFHTLNTLSLSHSLLQLNFASSSFPLQLNYDKQILYFWEFSVSLTHIFFPKQQIRFIGIGVLPIDTNTQAISLSLDRLSGASFLYWENRISYFFLF